MKMIEIHPRARENFNQKSEELVYLVKQIFDEGDKKSSGSSELYSSAMLTDKDIIGEFKINYTNGFGEDKGKAFCKGNKRFGIIDKDYETFNSYARNIYTNKSISKVVSINYIKEKLFEWVKSTYLYGKKNEYCDFLINCIDKDIKKFKIWMPVPFTMIGSSFQIGKIYFQTLTESNIDEWFNSKQPNINDNDQARKIEEVKVRIKKDFQGYAVGVFECIAEAKRAEELAFENFTKSLSILRVFSSANLAHEITNGTYEYGHKMMRTKTFFISAGEGISYTSGILDSDIYWGIKSDEIKWMTKYFKKVDILLNEDDINKFQKKVFESLIVYSKSCLKRDVSDRILYILVALETMLLKNTSEPIQQNIGERLALIIGKDADDKKNIVKTIRDIYKIRSKFIHHGVIVEENTELLRKFMLNAWVFFLRLIDILDKYTSKDEFLDDIDHLKYI